MTNVTWVDASKTFHLVKQDWKKFTLYVFDGGVTTVLYQICKQKFGSLSSMDMLTSPPEREFVSDCILRTALTC